MKLVWIISAIALMDGAPAPAPVEASSDLMERLSVEQLMRLATLPPARIAEMHCAGTGQWLVSHRPQQAGSPARAAADRLSADVAAAIAHDAELPTDAVREMLASIAVDAGNKVEKEGEAALAKEMDGCASLYVAAAAPEPLKLHPLANTSVVNPALASCYAQYRLAASLSEGKEAANLKASADKAYQLALKGKTADSRTAAETALEAEFQAAAKAPQADQEAAIMRLIVCQPLMTAADGGGR